MKLLFKQRLFSWLDSYDIYEENGNSVYSVKGQISFGHCLFIYDRLGDHIATVKEKIFSFIPKFELYKKEQYIGEVHKEFTFFKPKFELDYRGWIVDGDFMEWNYQVFDSNRQQVMTAQKRIWNLTDTYEIDVINEEDALDALIIVLAIDAAKCSQNK